VGQAGGEEQVHAYLKAYCTNAAVPVGGIQVLISNSVWTTKDVEKAYIEGCVDNFSAEIRPMGSAEEINEYVETTTKGMIPKILEQAVRVSCIFGCLPRLGLYVTWLWSYVKWCVLF